MTESHPDDNIAPDWAIAVQQSAKMIEGSEEHLMWKLKYGSADNFWAEIIKGNIELLD